MKKHEEHVRRNPGITSSGAAAAAMAPDTAAENVTSATLIEHEEIALLAYSYWEARGCPYGSPEEDWFRAERDLCQKAAEL
jgi:hypothetical protein